jgi:hypothetical protein
MRLSKLDLSSVLAVAYSEEHLQLLLNRGDELELLAVPAPVAAFEGLQLLNNMIAETLTLPSPPIPMLPVESSMANAVGYDAANQVLQIEFYNGTTYQFEEVEPEIWDELHDTDSIGRYFNTEIRGNYESSRIYTEDEC